MSLDKFSKFKEFYQCIYKKYGYKLNPCYDPIYGLDPVKLEVILDKILAYKKDMSINSLESLSIQEKANMLFTPDEVDSLVSFF